jgi:hypothetical protein
MGVAGTAGLVVAYLIKIEKMKSIEYRTTQRVNYLLLSIIGICFSCVSNESNGNVIRNQLKKESVFANCDFKSNDFSLYIINTNPIKVEDNIYLYTRDTTLLKELKKLWVYDLEESYGRCAPLYDIYLKKNDTICSKFSLSVKCNEVFIKGKQFQFDAKKLFINVLNKFQTLHRYNFEFHNLKTRNSILSKIEKKSLVMNELTNSTKIQYETVFRFNYLVKVEYQKKRNFTEKKIIEQLNNQIVEKYPNEDFLLECSYFKRDRETEMNTYQMDLYCNESLYKKFNLYKKIVNFESRPLKLSFFSKKEQEFK